MTFLWLFFDHESIRVVIRFTNLSIVVLVYHLCISGEEEKNVLKCKQTADISTKPFRYFYDEISKYLWYHYTEAQMHLCKKKIGQISFRLWLI